MGSQTEIREVQSVSGMDCRTAESMVTRFIDHSLSVNELEEFLDHIETCPSCYDELETYFIVHEAMQQLEKRRTGQSLTLRNFWSRRSEIQTLYPPDARDSLYRRPYQHGSSCSLVCICDFCYIGSMSNRRTET